MVRTKYKNVQFCKCCGEVFTAKEYEEHQAQKVAHVEEEVARLALSDDHGYTSTTGSAAMLGGNTPTELQTISPRIQALFTSLVAIDNEREERKKEIRTTLCEWDQAGMPRVSAPQRVHRNLESAIEFLKRQREWMVATGARVGNAKTERDQVNEDLLRDIRSALSREIQMIDESLATWVNVYNLGVENAKNDSTVIDTTRYLNHPLQNTDNKSLIAMYIGLVLNVVFHLARNPCSIVLRLLNLLLAQSAVSPVYVDIRTLRKAFDLDPVTTCYASCPRCHTLYAPKEEVQGGKLFQIYPAQCNAARFPSSRGVCGTVISKFSGIQHGIATRAPIVPFTMQSFTHFCAQLYCRPGVQDMIKRYHRDELKRTALVEVCDINQAQGIRHFKDSDGNVFVDADHEIRTVWSISYDGYNPFHNKTAGKSASVGALGMACLSLPPSVRTKRENLYLAGLVTGPRQPRLDGLNPYLYPLVKTLKVCYHTGTWHTATPTHPEGIRSREAVIPSINDLPGANKVICAAGHSAKIFCAKCHITKDKINTTDPNLFPMRTNESYRESALAYRNATTVKERKKLVKANGIRYTVLLELDYWDPVKNVVPDGMHTLFLGVVRHHFMKVIGTNWKNPEEEEDDDEVREAVASEKELQRGRKLLVTSTATKQHLQRLSIAALSTLCEEFGVQPHQSAKKSRQKRKVNFIFPLLATVSPKARPPTPMASKAPPSSPHSRSAAAPAQASDADIVMAGIGDTIYSSEDEDEELESIPFGTAMLETEDLLRIQAIIAQIRRPPSQPHLPSNYGSPSHGKLKSSQWATAIDFDLPIALVKMWIVEKAPDVDRNINQRRMRAIDATVYLSISLRWATSSRISDIHPDKYLYWMRKYLDAMLELHPTMDLKPSHHAALHIHEFLKRFGPMRGWWMYFFEQLIGLLQLIKINYKFGEIEATVLKTFSSISQVRTIAQRPGCPDILRECAKILEDHSPSSSTGFNLLSVEDDPTSKSSKPQRIGKIDDDVEAVLRQDKLLAASYEEYRFFTIRGQRFSPKHASVPQSLCFFPDAQGRLVPGRVRQILAIQGVVHLVLHRFITQEPSAFDGFPEFGAEVWSIKTEHIPLIVPVPANGARIYPMNYLEWTPSSAVMRPLIDIVSQALTIDTHLL